MWEKLLEELTLLRRLKSVPKGIDINSREYREASEDVPYVCLYLDSHSSHIYDADVLEDMLYHKVLVLNYQSHCTHVFQPLDSGIIRSIKV